jgi:hypothetical protein
MTTRCNRAAAGVFLLHETFARQCYFIFLMQYRIVEKNHRNNPVRHRTPFVKSRSSIVKCFIQSVHHRSAIVKCFIKLLRHCSKFVKYFIKLLRERTNLVRHRTVAIK